MEFNDHNGDLGAKAGEQPSALGFAYLRPLGAAVDGLIHFRSDRVYTVGRRRRYCDLVLLHRCVSNRHCQIFLDGSDRKLRLIDGFRLPRRSHLHEIRRSFRSENHFLNSRVSLNGVFVNGRRVKLGTAVELSVGHEVLFACRGGSNHGCKIRCGFVVERIVFSEAKVVREDFSLSMSQCRNLIPRSLSLLNQLRGTRASSDPVSSPRNLISLHIEKQQESLSSVRADASIASPAAPEKCCRKDCEQISNSLRLARSHANAQDEEIKNSSRTTVEIIKSSNCQPNVDDVNAQLSHSDGRTFFLNRLKPIGPSTAGHCNGVTLPELLHPMKTLVRVFIATFTCDVSWFLSYCQVPNHLPVTVACHSTERCWSACYDNRTLEPHAHYPNLLLVYPPFPDDIAFGKDRKKKGVACHHPKLFVLQRNEALRVIVTSANLVPKQWDYITNTVWWQDFPCRTAPDYSALFGGIEDLKNDFAAQLASFVASLLVDVPSQAHWINELTKYDFGKAACHLVTSLPGVHTSIPSYVEAAYCLSAKQIVECKTSGNILGSVQASVVGLSHRFYTSVDPNGGQVKKLASILGRCRENTNGTVEVLLKRNTNILADANAVGVIVAADLDEFSEEDSLQLGFLPRDVAKWLSPLSDIGFISFSAFIYPKDALAATVAGDGSKVHLLLYVSEGPTFTEIPRLILPEHYVPLCSLVASLHRCLGLWRLRQILSKYKWPESLEVDFVYGSSSIGTSVNSQFFSAFSAAARKRSYHYPDSEESDPEWGCWTAANELKRPSIRILFPTIKRAKNGHRGIQDSRCLLSLSEKTWQRLKTTGIFHDCIPSPCERLGYPMHMKVAQRRFHSGKSTSPFGWIYVGSHNFSPAAWGHTLFPPSQANVAGVSTTTKLRICNYELGIIFLVPPPDLSKRDDGSKPFLDDFVLPFVMPAPGYRDDDRPATAQAMREALAAQVTLLEDSLSESAMEEMNEDVLDEEEEIFEEQGLLVQENEEEKVYAEMLWNQVDSSES